MNSSQLTEKLTIKRVALVDDEPSVLFALKLLLEAFGYEVTAFEDPESALTHITGPEAPDCCLCDLRMPKLNGLQVLAEFKKYPRACKFVLMSAHATDQELLRARALGVDGTLTKPFSPEQLKDLMDALSQGI